MPTTGILDTTNLSALALEGGLGVASATNPVNIDWGTAGYILTSGGSQSTPIVWKAPSSIAFAGSLWDTEGNSGLSSATNFIGTTDAVALVFKANGTTILVMDSTGSSEFQQSVTFLSTLNTSATANFNGSATNIGNAASDALTVTAYSVFSNSATFNAATSFTQSATFTSTLNADSTVNLNGSAINIGNNSADVMTVTANSLFSTSAVFSVYTQFGEGSVNANGYMNLRNTGSATILTGTTQQGLTINLTGNSAATSQIQPLNITSTTFSASFTVANLDGINIAATIGSGSTVTAYRGIRFNINTAFAAVSSSGYFIGDAAPTGKYSLYMTNTNPSVLGGALTVGVASTSVHTLNTAVATSASAGTLTLPANPIGFVSIVINGTTRNIPYYA